MGPFADEGCLPEDRRPVALEIQGGLIVSTIRGEDWSFVFEGKPKQALRYCLGISLRIPMGRNFGIRHELAFSTRGANVGLFDSVTLQRYRSSLKSAYIDLRPILLFLDYKGLEAYGGPCFSALASASIQRQDSAGSSVAGRTLFGKGDDNGQDDPYLQKLDFALVAGMRYRFSFGVSLGASYRFGLVPLYDLANSAAFGFSKTAYRLYNEELAFTLGIGLPARRLAGKVRPE